MNYNKVKQKRYGGVMKFLVFSDSHKYTSGMDKAIEKHKDITHIIHCGDVADDCEYLEMVYGKTHSLCFVSGNNDFFSSYPLSRCFKYEGKTVYITHGHKERVKGSLDLLLATGKKNCADICIFGHTHTQHFEEIDGLILLNPGSIGYIKEEYAIIDVTKENIDIEFCRV